MPEPASAFSVRRESKTGVNDVCASTSAGMPSRPMVRSSTACAGADLMHAVDQRQRAAARGGAARAAPVVRRSTGVANVGAPAALQNALIMSTTGCGSGLTRWNASPSRSGRCAEVVHRLGDVVDRHHVGVAEVDADQRQPARAGCRASASSAGRSSRGRRPCPSRRSRSGRPRSRAGRPATAPSPPRGRSAPTRTSCGGTPRAGAAPRRTSSRRRCRGSHRPRPPTTPGGSSPPAAPRPARGRAGCRRRSAARWSASSAVMS